MNELWKTAMFWKELGVSTIPVYYKSKQPKNRWIEYTTELPSDNLLGRWFASRYSNIAVVAGWNDLTIIDFDDMNAFNNWKTWAEASCSVGMKLLREGRMTYSARGVHLYIFCGESYNLKLPGIDILARNKYALIPQSVHPTGRPYVLYRDAMPVRISSIRELFPADVIEPEIAKQTAPVLTEQSSPSAPSPSLPYDPWSAASFGSSRSDCSVVDDIRRSYRIEDFFPRAVHSGGNGRWLIARCPFHNDRNPSLSIDLERQTCLCLSGHGCTPKPLDVIGLYAKLHNLTNSEAIAVMRQHI